MINSLKGYSARVTAMELARHGCLIPHSPDEPAELHRAHADSDIGFSTKSLRGGLMERRVDMCQAVRSRALSGRQDGIPEAAALTVRPCAGRRPPWFPSGRYAPDSTAVALLWPPPRSGHSGSGTRSEEHTSEL